MLGLVAASLAALAATGTDDILDVLDRFFIALERADTAAMEDLVDGDTLLRSLRQGPGGRPAESTVGRDAWLEGLAGKQGAIVELYWDPKVEVSPLGLGTAWVSYVVEVNGSRAHCGVDAFTLVRREGGWVITGLHDTRDPGGCARLGLEGARGTMRPAALRPLLKG